MRIRAAKRAAILAALAAAAMQINLAAPTVFFDVQIMLGASLGVFALLEFGCAGLLVGIAGLAVTFFRWKHPFAVLIGAGYLVWLRLFVDRFNGGHARRGDRTVADRGVAFAAVLMAVTLPGIGLTLGLSRHLWTAALESQLVGIPDHRFFFPLFLLLFGFLAVAAGTAEGIGALVNDRSRRINDLTAALASARHREREAESRTRTDLQAKLKTSLAAAAIVHEINRPLSNIVLGSNVASAKLADLGAAGEPLRPALSGLVRDSEHVVETIERMRMLLRSVQTDHGPVDVANVLHNAVTYAAAELEQHEVDVSVHGTDTACYVKGDAGQLQVAVVNLLRNAAEAIASGASASRCIEVELIRHPSADGVETELVELVVGDSGPGIVNPEVVNAPLVTTKPGGMGIGLFVVRSTVENHGGDLRVGRSPLGGAEFRIALAAQA